MTNRRIFLCTYTLLVILLFSIVHFVHAQEATTSAPQSSTATSAATTSGAAAATLSASSTTPQAPETTSVQNAPAAASVPNGTPLTPEEQQRVINLAANISNRMDAMVDRQQNILTRLQSRVLKMTQAGYDVSDTTNYLNDAVRLTANARQRLSGIDAEVQTAAGAGNPQFMWEQVVVTFTDIKNTLKTNNQVMLQATENLELIVQQSRKVAQ
jgi:hypothetical protein